MFFILAPLCIPTSLLPPFPLFPPTSLFPLFPTESIQCRVCLGEPALQQSVAQGNAAQQPPARPLAARGIGAFCQMLVFQLAILDLLFLTILKGIQHPTWW